MKRAQVHLKKIELDLLGLGAVAPDKLLRPMSVKRRFKKHRLRKTQVLVTKEAPHLLQHLHELVRACRIRQIRNNFEFRNPRDAKRVISEGRRSNMKISDW
jgi:hypothetical protein